MIEIPRLPAYCAGCGKQTDQLSRRSLCEKCQRNRTAARERPYDVATGKPYRPPRRKEASA